MTWLGHCGVFATRCVYIYSLIAHTERRAGKRQVDMWGYRGDRTQVHLIYTSLLCFIGEALEPLGSSSEVSG